VFTQLASLTWWKSAGLRALRTLLVVVAPFVPALVSDPAGAWVAAASTVALAVIASLVTSLANLPEVDGTPRPWWAAMLDRTVRTFFQAFLAGLGSAVLLSDVAWAQLAEHAAIAALGSLVLAVVSMLPEAQPATVPADTVVQIVGTDGSVIAGPASPLPDGTVITSGKHVA